jgi:hypothetical protein
MWRVNKLTGATYFCSSVASRVGVPGDVPADKGCVRLDDFTIDQAIAAAYLNAHPEEAKSFGVEMPTPKSTPSGRH